MLLGPWHAQVVGDRAGGQDEAVVLVASFEADDGTVEVHADDLGYPHVGGVLEPTLHRAGDVAVGGAGRGHLVQQRREGEEVVPVEDGDVDGLVTRRRAQSMPAKPAPITTTEGRFATGQIVG